MTDKIEMNQAILTGNFMSFSYVRNKFFLAMDCFKNIKENRKTFRAATPAWSGRGRGRDFLYIYLLKTPNKFLK